MIKFLISGCVDLGNRLVFIEMFVTSKCFVILWRNRLAFIAKTSCFPRTHSSLGNRLVLIENRDDVCSSLENCHVSIGKSTYFRNFCRRIEICYF